MSSVIMPEPVINLCSSLDSDSEINFRHRGTQSQPTEVAKASKPDTIQNLTSNHRGGSVDRWYDLSSDGLDSGVPQPMASLPLVLSLDSDAMSSEIQANLEPPKSPLSVREKSSPRDGRALVKFLSDDFDSTLLDSPWARPSTRDEAYTRKDGNSDCVSRSLEIENALPTNTKSSLSNAHTATKDLCARGANEEVMDFHYLSDILKGDVLDDSLTLLSSPKRRRVFSSPQPASSKIKKTKAAGYRRSASSMQTTATGQAWKIDHNSGPAKKKPSTALDLNPMVFTSSPDPFAETPMKGKHKKKAGRPESDDDEWLNDILDQCNATRRKFSRLSRSELGSSRIKDAVDMEKSSGTEELITLNSLRSLKPVAKSVESSLIPLAVCKSENEKNRRSREKELQNQTKSAFREAEKIRKLQEKKEIALTQARAAALAKVNTLPKKVDSTMEMIVDLPSCLNNKLADQIRIFLAGVKAEYHAWDTHMNVIKWRRKVKAKWDSTNDHWVPTQETVQDENYIMYFMTATEFVDLVNGIEGLDLDAHVMKIKDQFPSRVLIYLIEGMQIWFRKNRFIKERQFAEAVRSQLPCEPTATTMPRRPKKNRPEYVDEELVNDALLRLQVLHDALIHHTSVMNETAEWVMIFTQQISTVPYKKQLNTINRTNFCMESGQIASGKDTQDTYVKMLQEMRGVSAPIAWGIEAEYPTVQALITGFEFKGPDMLAECRISANKNGAFTDRRVGNAISRRIYSVFLGRDTGNWEF